MTAFLTKASRNACSVMTGLTLLMAADLALGDNLYRYVNEDGVQVLDSSIPPEYAQNGYEVLNSNGQLIEVVGPAPSASELAQQASEDEILYHFDRLRKRYSDVQSIEAARERRLANLETSISILKGNINSLQNQLDEQMGQAATREREGKLVPVSLLDKIGNSKAELAVAQELLVIRENEKVEVNRRFDKDIEYFVKGEALTIRRVIN